MPLKSAKSPSKVHRLGILGYSRAPEAPRARQVVKPVGSLIGGLHHFRGVHIAHLRAPFDEAPAMINGCGCGLLAEGSRKGLSLITRDPSF